MSKVKKGFSKKINKYKNFNIKNEMNSFYFNKKYTAFDQMVTLLYYILFVILPLNILGRILFIFFFNKFVKWFKPKLLDAVRKEMEKEEE